MLFIEPEYFFLLIKRIMEEIRRHITITGSNIYPILKNMEKEELITGKLIDNKRKLSKFTEKGKDFLKQLNESMSEFFTIFQELIMN